MMGLGVLGPSVCIDLRIEAAAEDLKRRVMAAIGGGGNEG